MHAHNAIVRAVLASAACASAAHAQSSTPAIFVANEGNLEGSVTSFLVEADGSLTFVDRVITGSRTSTSQPCAGCNTFAIDITPSGQYLATSHASGSASENFTVYEVGTDASLSVVEVITVPQGGLDLAWVRDDLLAVCITDLSGSNELRLYNWDSVTQNLTLADSDVSGSFLTSLAVHPSGQWVICNDSFANTARVYEVVGDQATLNQTIGFGVFGVSLAFSPNGNFAYAAGGISAGGNAFAGFSFDAFSGMLSELPGSPFTSPGASPKGFAFTPDGSIMFVSHGTDATIQSFSLDKSGVPISLGTSFDVGSQGTLQGMDTLDGRLFAMDDSTAFDGVAGAYSLDVDPITGTLTPVGGVPFATQGISPNDVVAWDPAAACVADFTGDGVLDFFDVSAFINAYNAMDPAADLTGDGVWDFFDVSAFVSAYNLGCP
ncbi:MAG: GC-type dockerin domain-anchored protein [Phycisphaerales bacterium]